MTHSEETRGLTAPTALVLRRCRCTCATATDDLLTYMHDQPRPGQQRRQRH